jgi:hypothetical protein
VLNPDRLDGDLLMQGGDLQITQPLVLDQSLGTRQSDDPDLVFNSSAANPRRPS